MRATRHLVSAHPVNLQHPLATGLVSWWLVVSGFDGAGARWLDLVAQRVATLTSVSVPPTATSGWGVSTRRGGWGDVRLDGTGDTITMGDRPEWSFTAGGGDDLPFSLHACVRLANVAAFQSLFSKRGGGSEWVSYVSDDGIHCRCTDSAGATWVGRKTNTLTGLIAAQEWFSYTMTYSGSNTSAGMAVYVNGQRRDTGDSASGAYTGMTSGNATVVFGNLDGGSLMTGAVDDVRIYNYELSAPVVAALHANSWAGYPGLLQTRQRRSLAPALLAVGQPVGAMMRMGVGR